MPTATRVSELPEAPYKAYVLEAMRRGEVLVGKVLSIGAEIILIGAIDMIRELSEKVESLERTIDEIGAKNE